jgi:hypothetical protein
VHFTYIPPPCGSSATFELTDTTGFSLSVQMDAPDEPTSCSSPSPTNGSVTIGDGSTTVTKVEHVPTGLVRQAQF